MKKLRIKNLGLQALWGLLTGVFAISCPAGQVILEATAPGQQFTVVNTSGQAIIPRIIVRGWTANRDTTPRFAQNLQLINAANNSTTGFEASMLTGATWILNPDGSAQWGYRSGAWETGYGIDLDPRLRVYDQDKLSLDHYPIIPLSSPYANGNYRMLIAAGQAPSEWTCRIQFPTGAIVKDFNGYANTSDSTHALPVAQIYADASLETLIAAGPFAGTNFIFGQTPQLPNNFYLRLTAQNITTHNNIWLYYTYFWANLDASSLPRLVLQPGVNTLSVNDSQQSSHQWRIILDHASLQADPPIPTPVPIPDNVTNYRSRFRLHPADPQSVVAPTNFFPLGLYYGLSPATLDFVVDDMVNLNCNAIHGTNMNITQLATILDLLDHTPLKLVYQGGSSSSLFYQSWRYFTSYSDPVQKEIDFNQQSFVPSANQYVPPLVNRPGLLSWNITEEIPADVPQRLHDNGYYTLMRTLDPSHPPTLLHNDPAAAASDLALNLPAAVIHDHYLFSLDPSSGGTNLTRSISEILRYVQTYRRLCDNYSVPLWFMAQGYGQSPPPEDYIEPPFGRNGGKISLSAPRLRMQGWLAVAEGARGIFFYPYQSSRSDFCGTVRDAAFAKNSEQWTGVQQLFGELRPLTRFLALLNRTEASDTQVQAATPLIARTFGRRDNTMIPGLYAVIVNGSDNSSVPLVVSGSAVQNAQIVWDIKRQQSVTGQTLAPGEGTVLWIGDSSQIDLDRALLVPQAFTVIGTMVLDDYPLSGGEPITVELRKPDGSRTGHCPTLDAQGAFVIPNVAAGTYEVRVIARHKLARLLSGIVISSDIDLGTINLVNGDVDENNSVTAADLSVVLSAIDAPSAEPPGDPRADLDGDGEITSSDLSIVLSSMDIVGDAPPAIDVAIISPTAGKVFRGLVNIPITASVYDREGTIGQVDFYKDGTCIGRSTGPIYTCMWDNATLGTHSLIAVAKDNHGTATSSAVSVTVKNDLACTLTSPANNSVYIAPASLTLTATATASIGTINRVDFYADNNLLGSDDNAPFTYVWNNPPVGRHILTTKAMDNYGTSQTSLPVDLTVWTTQDIGTIGQTGSAVYAVPTYTVTGAGSGIIGTTDAFRFVYLPISGNCTITARVASFTSTIYSQARAGVMMRQDTALGATEFACLFGPQMQNVYFHHRTAGGGTTSTESGPAAAAPYWVKLVRSGNTFKAYMSADTNGMPALWTQVGQTAGWNSPMNDLIQVGLAVTSGTTTATKTATFDNVSLAP